MAYILDYRKHLHVVLNQFQPLMVYQQVEEISCFCLSVFVVVCQKLFSDNWTGISRYRYTFEEDLKVKSQNNIKNKTLNNTQENLAINTNSKYSTSLFRCWKRG